MVTVSEPLDFIQRSEVIENNLITIGYIIDEIYS